MKTTKKRGFGILGTSFYLFITGGIIFLRLPHSAGGVGGLQGVEPIVLLMASWTAERLGCKRREEKTRKFGRAKKGLGFIYLLGILLGFFFKEAIGGAA